MNLKKSSRTVIVTGGQRSGKSLFAESLALSLADKPVYLATARIYDAEMQHRVEEHKRRREAKWKNIESPLYISGHSFSKNDVVLVDCITMLATNWFLEKNESIEETLIALKEEINLLMASDATFIIVTNEIGLGGISGNEMLRKFVDVQGEINQYVASLADEVYMMISGIPIKIK